ncbi:MAG TPA: class I SAM-dependent methyltransferase [Pyrinomonadaceae bacterium]|nr:class I SAM-dependent methyltransferase [Pyrinomonadaceae bacterium]
MSNLYEVAGIEDIAGFYRDRFFTGGVLDARYFDSINRFNIQYARTMWVYDNVCSGSRVLDLGCGEGMLALLKRKDITVVGVDLSSPLVVSSLRNGYDAGCVAKLTALPFADSSFDYVISLDVMGHIPCEDKDRVLAEAKRVLRPGGVTMHGIECLDRDIHQDYETMNDEKLRHFIAIDGHIGLEEEDEHTSRFRSLFNHVQSEPRYSVCLSSQEFLKQADDYGVTFERDFVDYLRGLSFAERRAFDMAMGYVFAKISDLGIRLPKSGLYMLLKASDEPLGPFYNAHRDRRELLRMTKDTAQSDSVCLDYGSAAAFDAGWYAANYLPPVARWMSARSVIRFDAPSLSKVTLDLTTHIPDLESQPLELQFILNGLPICAFSLFKYGWLELKIDLPSGWIPAGVVTSYELEIRADRTWEPCTYDRVSSDDRALSIAVCNIEINY